ncbi:MAG: hypothetical protein R3D30_10485 [Hyphomicrobiales bacterium]
MLNEAKAQKGMGQDAAAIESLNKARGLSPCKETLAAIDAALGRSTKTASEDKRPRM